MWFFKVLVDWLFDFGILLLGLLFAETYNGFDIGYELF